jgi:acyl-homoserine lactone acylase PvdQ
MNSNNRFQKEEDDFDSPFDILSDRLSPLSPSPLDSTLDSFSPFPSFPNHFPPAQTFTQTPPQTFNAGYYSTSMPTATTRGFDTQPQTQSQPFSGFAYPKDQDDTQRLRYVESRNRAKRDFTELKERLSRAKREDRSSKSNLIEQSEGNSKYRERSSNKESLGRGTKNLLRRETHKVRKIMTRREYHREYS